MDNTQTRPDPVIPEGYESAPPEAKVLITWADGTTEQLTALEVEARVRRLIVAEHRLTVLEDDKASAQDRIKALEAEIEGYKRMTVQVREVLPREAAERITKAEAERDSLIEAATRNGMRAVLVNGRYELHGPTLEVVAERDAMAAQVAAVVDRVTQVAIMLDTGIPTQGERIAVKALCEIVNTAPKEAARYLAADAVARAISALDYERADHWRPVTTAVDEYRSVISV